MKHHVIRWAIAAVLGVGLAAGLASLASAQEATVTVEYPLVKPARQAWSFAGIFGQYDQAQLQRGYKVYKEVCASCHSMNLVHFRNLGDRNGPFWNPKYPNPNDNPVVKTLAGEVQVNDIDSETGEPIRRDATPADRFPDPYPNATAAAAANGGAAPPDLSVMGKARHDGANYIYSLLTGYRAAPAGLQIREGQHYNPYMAGDLTPFWTGDHKHVPPGGFIAMAPPLAAGQVTFDDGTKSTLDQQAKDVSAFLMWAAEPKLEERKQTGFAVIIYLLLLSGLLYASYKTVWRNESH